ncbi:hypothetical protein GOBAR_AA05696 [Gossypium barbadense]|uniref:Uncharacterized protein n=1 Tax=Gossypium barbadense TaxID=3634 RepID=A0A2P5YH30_GOSBA|nr:hypothetical protein GOBAR_AA05696 [Gossypium barbadense]
MAFLKWTIRTDCRKTQLERLYTVSPLIIDDLVIVRNVFLYCFEGHSPNGHRLGGSRKVVEALGLLWDEASSTDGGLLAGIDYSSENNLSETDSISHEISEAMDIDYLIRGTRKKRKTTTMAENVTFTMSLQSVPPVSSPIPADEHFPPIVPYISPSVFTNEEIVVEGDRRLFPWHDHLSAQEYPYNPANVAQK